MEGISLILAVLLGVLIANQAIIPNPPIILSQVIIPKVVMLLTIHQQELLLQVLIR